MRTLGELALRARMAKRLEPLSDADLSDAGARMRAYLSMGGSEKVFGFYDLEALIVETVRRREIAPHPRRNSA